MADKKFSKFFISFLNQPDSFPENYASFFNAMANSSGHFESKDMKL